MFLNAPQIAIVIPKYGLLEGAERFAYELTERLSLNEEYDFHVFTNRGLSGSDRITFHKVPEIPYNDQLCLVCQSKNLKNEPRPDSHP